MARFPDENLVKKNSSIQAIVLAAGESRRMGEPKMLLPWGGTTVLEAVLANVLSSSVGRTLVVLGAERERLEPLVRKYPVRPVFNPKFKTGMLSSVRAGFRALPPSCRAALVFLGDQPRIGREAIERVISAYFETGKGLVVPDFQGAGGHPLLVDMKYRAAVERLSAGIGLRGLFSFYPKDIHRVMVDEGSILLDLDTPADYRRARARRPARKSKPG
jgi:molybdenum cofactor cytidylyltransferase